MQEKIKTKQYKSPLRKLVVFFEKSRDNWKTKYFEAKKIIKKLTNRNNFLENSKAKLNVKVKKLEKELRHQQKENQKITLELEALKKKSKDNSTQFSLPEAFTVKPHHHKYSVGHILLFINLVLSAGISLRAAAKVIEIFVSTFDLSLPTPSWYTGRLWILRFGLYKLQCKKERSSDWAIILDHTIKIGPEKCLLILGIRLSNLPSRCLKQEDLEPIDIIPVRKSNGKIVYEQLEKTSQKIGIPSVIVSDHGSDLKSGIKEFCKKHPEVRHIYDIKHKTAIILKQQLENNKDWLEFCKLAGQTKKKIQQTELAPLAPPNQRSKARYMNVDILVTWGMRVLSFINMEKTDDLDVEFDQKQLDEKLGWINSYQTQLEEWEELFDVVSVVENYVRNKGLHRKAHLELKKILASKNYTYRTSNVRSEIIAFIGEESSKANSSERLPGSSEIIESVFGKQKRLDQEQTKSGFTGLVLGIGAMVSSVTKELVEKAMKTISNQDLIDWCTDNIGLSVQAKRKKIIEYIAQAEQKTDQLAAAA